MTNLEQAAKEYAEKHHALSLHTTSDLGIAFLAGAAHAEGAFVEWILPRFSPIEFFEGEYKWWDRTTGGKHFTTSELYQLWQQSLS